MDQEQQTTGGAPLGGTTPQKYPTMLIVGAVLILILVAWFMLMKGGGEPMPLDSQAPDTMLEGSAGVGGDANATPLSTQGTSDELGAIEADLNATDLKSLDDVDQI